MKRLLTLLLLAFLTTAAFAADTNKFVGIWVVGGIEKGNAALFIFSNGKAYFNAMCGKAAGTWSAQESSNQIEVQLREESEGPFDSFTFKIDNKGWLIRKSAQPAAPNSPASVAAEALQMLEKSQHELPKTE
ncbi:MAG: hypothetical protein WBL62_01930 [Gallionella sp.]